MITYPGCKGFSRSGLRAALIAALVLLPPVARAQTDPLGPSFASGFPVESGSINLANGNLHLTIPITSSAQRGKITYSASLVYDSRIWEASAGGWHPDNVLTPQGQASWAGWRLATSVDPGYTSFVSHTITSCGPFPTDHVEQWSPWMWTDPDGTERVFNILTQQVTGTCSGYQNIASAQAYAEDSSGYLMSVGNYNQATITAKDGTTVFDATQSAYSVKGPNGNYFTGSGTGVEDTLTRVPISATAHGGTTTYQVLSFNSGTANYVVVTQNIDVCTNFQKSQTTEYCSNGNPALQLTAIKSIQFPDGTTYQFGYDSGTSSGHYGELTSVTLPTAATVNYGYANFTDAQTSAEENRWVSNSSNSVDNGTWSYTPQAGVTCPAGSPSGATCNQLTVTKPSGDQVQSTFIIANGAWDAQTQYKGSSGVLMTVANTYDFSQNCGQNCGPAFIRLLYIRA